MKHNIENASPFATKQLGDKLNKVLTREERELAESAQRKLRYELNEKDARQKWYLELMIAACLGAALALGFVA